MHWTNDLPGALSQIRRALRPDGLFIGSLFGGSSLQELRWALGRAELELTGGQAARVSPFADAFDGAGLLQRAGFALPVSDIDRLTVTYAGEPVFRYDMHTGVSANPFVSFTTRAVETGDLTFEWREDGGATFTRTARLVVT